MMVYEKALSRKNILGSMTQISEEALDEETSSINECTKPQEDQSSTKSETFWRRILSQRKKIPPKHTKEAASLGKIFNLLRGDVYDVAQRFWEVDSLLDTPIGLVIATILVWTLLGPSCFLGIIALLAAQAINAFISRILLRWERVRRAISDTRLQITTQFVEAIRHLRWYGWQNHWIKQVMEARQHELNIRIITSLWGILVGFVNAFASGAFPVLALYAYTFLSGHELRIDVIFPALQLFTMLETRLQQIPSLITCLINASIALGRIEDFMSEPDKEVMPSDQSEIQAPIVMKSCSFAWPGKMTPVLVDVDVSIPKGLTVVTGKVGAGKTAFLQALLGELDTISGSSEIPNEMVGYCAQTPWLQSMSIRDNILFSAPYHDKRYKETLKVCALLPDLSQFKDGDSSLIGENGIGLSGGQKARVALARAVYCTSRILFLDDPLSALDHQTAQFVVRKCFRGPLMKDRTVVLVTHRTALVSQFADQIIGISEKQARVLDKQVNATEESGNLLHLNDEDEPETDTVFEEQVAAVPDKFIEEEYRPEGRVMARVYWNYIKAGKYRWWSVLIAALALYRLMAVAQSWFLKGWGEAYEQTSVLKGNLSQSIANTPAAIWSFSSSADTSLVVQNPMQQFPSPQEDVRPWLWAFFGIVSLQATTLLVTQLLMLVIVYYAGQSFFQQALIRVSHSTFRYLGKFHSETAATKLTWLLQILFP